MPDARVLGLVGLIGALVFPAVVAVLTVRDWDFLRGRGWHPIEATDVPYPSILAVGRLGFVQAANFVVLGAALLATGAGLWQALEPRPAIGVLLVAGAGVASLALVAPTDGSVSKVRSVAGAIHAGAFLALLVCSVLAALLLGLAFDGVRGWEALAVPSLAVAGALVVLTIASFVLPRVGGLASLLLELVMLGWVAVVAARLMAAG